jgi:ribosomal protein S12 methylthiotransferase
MSSGRVRRAAMVRLGCARNDVDSEELAGRLAAGGWSLVDDAAESDVVVVNTCGFIEAAKKDSIDALLEAAELKKEGRVRAVVAVGCLAERYGNQLADSLPEADAVLGFDAYPQIGEKLDAVLRGEAPPAHLPRDRRRLLPLMPAARPAARAARASADRDAAEPSRPTLGGPAPVRLRLGGEPVAPLKLATGCDRRCTFCAIPFFRGAFVSRPPDEILAEAAWLADNGVRELFLVSENSTSYGKDFGNLRALERLLPELAAIPGIVRVRVSYLQPAELRPALVEAICTTPGVAAYFDLSFQHASGMVLRRMRRFGDGRRFLELLRAIRELAPSAGVRSNVIVGFPGETRADVAELERFLESAELDAIGVFGYSDEDGTEAATYDRKVTPATITRRVSKLTDLAEQLTAARAQDRVGGDVAVLVEEVGLNGPGRRGEPVAEGRAEHQGPEVDGSCRLVGPGVERLAVGDFVSASVVGSEGVDLIATLRFDASPADPTATAGARVGAT